MSFVVVFSVLDKHKHANDDKINQSDLKASSIKVVLLPDFNKAI